MGIRFDSLFFSFRFAPNAFGANRKEKKRSARPAFHPGRRPPAFAALRRGKRRPCPGLLSLCPFGAQERRTNRLSRQPPASSFLILTGNWPLPGFVGAQSPAAVVELRVRPWGALRAMAKRLCIAGDTIAGDPRLVGVAHHMQVQVSSLFQRSLLRVACGLAGQDA